MPEVIYLNVPFVNQSSFGNPDDPSKDPTGCWYASAMMVAGYFEYGPRLGLPELFTKNVGTYKDGTPMIGHQAMSQENYPRFLANEHLVAIPVPDSKQWKTDDLAHFLRIYGPLAFRWIKTSPRTGNKYGHVSVLIGANGEKHELIIHDPENRPNFHMSTADFNKQYNWASTVGGLYRREDGEYRMKSGLVVHREPVDAASQF